MKRNRIRAFASLFVVPLVLALALPALAAEQTGKLNGTVYDPDGVPLAGVTVTITSTNMMGKRQIQTSEDGGFLFFGLPPGRYAIQIDQSGFLPYKQEDVRVSIGGTATLDILLEVPTAEETITVTAKRPVVDKEKTMLGHSYDDEFLEDVPIPRQYQSVAQLAPGVVGGGNPNIHGGTLISNQYLVDGVTVTDPVTGTFSANFNFDAIKEVQVLTGGLDAEFGQATGGVINLVTRSGGNEFHVDTSIYLRPRFLKLEDDFEKEGAPGFDAYEGNLNVGGPIIKDKLWYFASVELSYSETTISATEDYFDPTNPEKVQPDPRTWFSVYYLGKLTWQMTPKHKLTFMTQGDPTWIENMSQSPFVASEAESARYQGGSFYTLAWEALWSKSLFQKTQIAYKDNIIDQYPKSGCRSFTDPACAGRYDALKGLYTDNYTSNSYNDRRRLQFDSSWTLYLDDLLGDHEWKAGWQYNHVWEIYRQSIPGGVWYRDFGGRPDRATFMTPDDDGVVREFDSPTEGDTLGVYLQDAWKITKNLILKPGVRFDYGNMKTDQGDTILEFATTSPRVNLVWDITGDGKTVMRAGYNRYVSLGNLMFAGWLNKSMATETYSYNPDTGQYDDFYSSSGGASNTYGIKEDLTAPHTDEITLQFERELFTDFSLAVVGLWRETKHLFEDDGPNVIWDSTGNRVIGFTTDVRDDIFEMDTPKEAWHRYWGFELIARKNFSDNWQLSASYTYSRAEGAPDYDAGGGIYSATLYLDIPAQNKYFWSWLPYDRRHVLKVDGGYHLPFGINIGASAFWATGYPYSKYVLNDRYGGYYNYDFYAGYDREHPDDPYWFRFPDILGLDLKVVWALKELTGQQIDIIGELNNVLHLRDKSGLVTYDYPPGSPQQFGDWTGHRSGFAAALGVRYRY